MTGPDLRLGLIGCGRLAEVGYAPAIAAVDGVTLVAVADADPARTGHLARLASGSGAPVAAFADAASLVREADVNALVLATPAAAHVADASTAVAAGLPVLVEKPPAPDAAGAAELVALGPLVRVGFNRRFDPGAQAVRNAVPPTGDLQLQLELRYRRASWGAHTVRDDVLLDLAPHLVDWARWLTGSHVTTVTAERAEPDRATLLLTLGRGRAVIRAAADSVHRERIEVRDGRGTAIARHRVGGLVAALAGRVRRDAGGHPLARSLAAQVDAFARTVRGEPAHHLGTAVDGHAVMAVIDAARASAADAGRPTPVVDPVEQAPC